MPDAPNALSPLKRSCPLAVLVAVDLGSKALAYATLPPDETVDADALFQIVLRVNDIGLGAWAQAMLKEAGSTEHLRAQIGMGYLGLASGVLAASMGRLALLAKASRMAGGALAGWLLGFVIVSSTGALPLPLLVALARLGPTALFCVLWWVALPGYWRSATFLFSAAGLGNLLCLAWPPFAIVDFMYSQVVTDVLKQGVFNVADIYFDCGIAVAFAALVRALVRARRRFVTRDA